jgi:hypothetical protein
MKHATLPAVRDIDPRPIMRTLTNRTNNVLLAFRAVSRARLTLVRQFSDGVFQSRAKLVRPGELACMRRLEGMTHFLYFAAVPQTESQIEEAMLRGKIRSTAKDTRHATYCSLRYGAKHGRFTCVGKAVNGERLWIRS